METLCGPIVPDPSCTVIAARRRRWQLRVPLLTQRASGVEGDEQRPAPSCALHGTAHTAVHGIHMDHCVAVGCMGAEVGMEVGAGTVSDYYYYPRAGFGLTSSIAKPSYNSVFAIPKFVW